MALLFMSQVGYYFMYSFRQYELRELAEARILSGLPESSLEVIADSDAIIWEEEGREFTLGGQLYDVAKITSVGGKRLIYCLNDRQEKRLLDELANATASGKENNADKNSKHLAKFQCNEFISDQTEKYAYIDIKIRLKHLEFASAIFPTVKDIEAPPPKLHCQS